MKRTFIETSTFTRIVDSEGRELLPLILSELLERMESGPVIPGTGGLRKLRISSARRGKGKRGGYRVIYLDHPEKKRTYLLGIYGKDEKSDLSSAEKRILKGLVEHLKQEAR